MGVFDNYKEIDGKVVDNTWIEWVHFNIPNKPETFRFYMQFLMSIFGHCKKCVVLDGCYFIRWNMPKNEVPGTDGLLHPRCDCSTKEIPFSVVKFKASSQCDIGKFTNYIFKDNGKDKGKKQIFKDMGFGIEDSDKLKEEFEKLALEQYLKGNYKLKELDGNGQRLAIPIELKGVKFYTGWMLYPEGFIRNTTPFAGWINEK